MTHKKNIRTVAAGAFMLAMIIPLSACGTDTSSSAPTSSPAAASCLSDKPDVRDHTPTVAILGETGSKLVSYQPDINMVVGVAKTEKAHILVNGVSAGDSAPDLLSNVVLDGQGNNTLMRAKNLNCKTTAVKNSIATLRKAASAKQPNAFDAITTLAGNLDKDPSKRPVDVVLLTPLSASAGGVDLTEPGTLDNPVAAINSLAKQGLIPSCTNYRFYGVSPDTGLSDVQAAKLREFWLLYAKKCGGELVAWESHLATFPVTSPISPVDYSQIRVQTTPQSVTATLGSDVLFGADTAQLQSAATPALNELKDLAMQYAGKIIITGYVNPVVPGTNSPGGRALSKQRAAAVASWLVAHDVAEIRITTVGNGTADAVYPDPVTDAQRSANRRVVAVIYTKGA